MGNSAARADRRLEHPETIRNERLDALSIEKLMNELHYLLMGVTLLGERRIRVFFCFLLLPPQRSPGGATPRAPLKFGQRRENTQTAAI